MCSSNRAERKRSVDLMSLPLRGRASLAGDGVQMHVVVARRLVGLSVLALVRAVELIVCPLEGGTRNMATVADRLVAGHLVVGQLVQCCRFGRVRALRAVAHVEIGRLKVLEHEAGEVLGDGAGLELDEPLLLVGLVDLLAQERLLLDGLLAQRFLTGETCLFLAILLDVVEEVAGGAGVLGDALLVRLLRPADLSLLVAVDLPQWLGNALVVVGLALG